MKNTPAIVLAAVAASASARAASNIQITEFMYTGLFGEFIEITNVGTTGQDMTGWRFSDNRRAPFDPTRSTSLASIGILGAGESAIITEVSATIFIQAWYTEPGVTPIPAAHIIANNLINLGRADEINIYNSAGTLWDFVIFSNTTGPDSDNVSVKPDDTLPGGGLDPFISPYSTWLLSATFGTPTGNAWKSSIPLGSGSIGSPGVYPN